ncbi:MAG TPA: peptidoglycan DD-metalloendopeptidase family protein [Xanthobacteraceae bacterium]|nr:peptidoglycan DD-metalloendopeptidase family protein [Xanthobacteraceae bacterium]
MALPFGANLVAFAQSPVTQVPLRSTLPSATAPSADDAIRQHDQELDSVRSLQRQSVDSQAKLRLQIEALSEDRRGLNQQLIESAAAVRDVEAKIDDAQSRLQSLDAREQVFQKSLDERRSAIIEILAALQRVGQRPPPALLVRPEDALKALRTAITLGAVVPDMRAEADAIAGDLAELSRVRKDIVSERATLSQNLDRLANEQLRLNMLIDARQKKQATTEQALDTERQHAVDLSHQVDNLKDLIAKLEASLTPATRAARDSARGIEADSTRPKLAALGDPGRLAPAIAFANARGHLRLPVNGVPIRAFGASDGVGGTQKGLSIATHAGAQITAPCDGWVVYAGPFRSYGQLLILNAGGGYHVLLAGMERISVDLGQFVLTGEPVAVMGGQAQLSAAVAIGSKKPALYVEFRKDGTPIDPSPWWATNEGEKARG